MAAVPDGRGEKSKSAHSLRHRAEQRTPLVHGFLVLGRGIGVVHDAGAGLDVQAGVLGHGGTDRDGGIRIAPPAPP